MKKQMILRVKEKFDSAHKLNDYHGKCSNLHGHTWQVEVYIKIKEIQPNGISIKFEEIKSFLKDFLPDHQYLNDYLNMHYPTAENLVIHLFNGIKKRYENLLKVVLWETEQNGVEYSEV